MLVCRLWFMCASGTCGGCPPWHVDSSVTRHGDGVLLDIVFKQLLWN